MIVTFLGSISRITGVRKKGATAASVRELLEGLLQEHGRDWRDQVFDGQNLVDGVSVVVNGTNVGRIQGLSTPLSSGDEIVLLPLFEGG
ncbi:MAG: MoaD/ThiS family protein [bacterium]